MNLKAKQIEAAKAGQPVAVGAEEAGRLYLVVDEESNEDQNSGKLVFELPQDAGMRKKLLQYSGVVGAFPERIPRIGTGVSR